MITENAMAADARPRTVHIRVDMGTKNLLRMVKEMLGASEGGSPLYLHAEAESGEHLIKTKMEVNADEAVLEQIRRILGGGQRRAWVE
jgi:hypothetical protein